MSFRMKNAELARRINTKRVTTLIVRSDLGKGIKRWSSVYRLVVYVAQLQDDGRILWGPVSTSPRMTAAELAHDPDAEADAGSVCNAPVTLSQALEAIGARGVKRIESHGWKFYRPPEVAT
jgi:hypothetical protein